MFYLLNPTAYWRQTETGTYVVSVGNHTYEISGGSCRALFDWILPALTKPLSIAQLAESVDSELIELLPEFLQSACSINLVLIRQRRDDIADISELIRNDLLADLYDADTLASMRTANLALDFIGDRQAANLLGDLIDQPWPINHYDLVDQYTQIREATASMHEPHQAIGAPSRIAIFFNTGNSLPELIAMNRHCLAQNRWWIPVTLGTTHASVGPLVIPFQGPCFECAMVRHAAVSPEGKLVYRAFVNDDPTLKHRKSVAPFSRAVAAQALGLVAVEACLVATPGCQSGLIGRVVMVSHLTLGAKYHRLLRVPSCPSCSESMVAVRHPWSRLSVTVEEVIGHSIVRSIVDEHEDASRRH